MTLLCCTVDSIQVIFEMVRGQNATLLETNPLKEWLCLLASIGMYYMQISG